MPMQTTNQGWVMRELESTDLDALLALYTHLHDKDDPPPARSELVRLWQTILADRSQIYMGGFIDGGDGRGSLLVSACNAAVIPNLTRGARPYAVIENVVTHADHRRRGYGAQLMRELLARCWARHCYKVMLLSARHRQDMYGFYEALGFDTQSKQAFVISAR